MTVTYYDTVTNYFVNSATQVKRCLPDSIQHDGAGVSLGWRDMSPFGNHFTSAHGSPALDYSLVEPGILFDGVDDWLDGAFSIAADQPFTSILIAKLEAVANGMIWECSDTGAIARCSSLTYNSTNYTAEAPEGTNAQCGFVDTNTTDLQIILARYDRTNRRLLLNGEWKASSCIPTTSARVPTVQRMGAYLSGVLPINMIVCGQLQYTGDMNNEDQFNLLVALAKRFGTTVPYVYPTPPADAQSTTYISLPARIPVVRDSGITIFKDPYYNGTDLSVTCDLQVSEAQTDRWSIETANVEERNFSITDGTERKTSILDIRTPLSGAPRKRIVCMGDSNTARGGSGWIQLIGDELGSQASFHGTVGPNAPNYSYKHEGHDSWTATDFVSPGSPIITAGVINIPAYYVAISVTAIDLLILSLFTNAAYNETDSSLPGALVTEGNNIQRILDAFFATNSSLKVVLAHPVAASSYPDDWGGGWPVSAKQVRKNMRYAAQYCNNRFDGRSNIIIAPTILAVDPIQGYDDAPHPNTSPGHVQIAKYYMGAVTKAYQV